MLIAHLLSFHLIQNKSSAEENDAENRIPFKFYHFYKWKFVYFSWIRMKNPIPSWKDKLLLGKEQLSPN